MKKKDNKKNSKRNLISIDVDDRISECAHAKNCFNDLCELEIDREAYDSHLKYCYTILAECHKLMEEYQIP